MCGSRISHRQVRDVTMLSSTVTNFFCIFHVCCLNMCMCVVVVARGATTSFRSCSRLSLTHCTCMTWRKESLKIITVAHRQRSFQIVVCLCSCDISLNFLFLVNICTKQGKTTACYSIKRLLWFAPTSRTATF